MKSYIEVMKGESFADISRVELIINFGLGSRKDKEIILFGGETSFVDSKTTDISRFSLEKCTWLEKSTLPWENDKKFCPLTCFAKEWKDINFVFCNR